MQLYLQMGHGMMSLAKKLVSTWGEGMCILSPRDMTLNQMQKFSKDIHKFNGSISIDPQFYQPHSEHAKLVDHTFWPDSYSTNNFFTSAQIHNMISILWNDYNQSTQSDVFIIPTRFSNSIDDDWEKYNDLLLNEVKKFKIEIPIYMTLSLSSEILHSEDMIHRLLEYVEDWDVSGFYIVAQHPKDNYLIADPIWLAGLIDLCAGLKLLDKKIIVGYSNQQQFYLSLAKIDAIATGTWLNVRSFDLNKFDKKEDDSISRKTTWYYCPQSLSEYQLLYLDMAKRIGSLDKMKSESLFKSNYADILFSGAQPTAVDFSESQGFCHYLQCMKIQASLMENKSFNETYLYLTQLFETAGRLSSDFKSQGIRAKYKDFSDVYEDTIAALDVFKSTRGAIFNYKWSVL